MYPVQLKDDNGNIFSDLLNIIIVEISTFKKQYAKDKILKSELKKWLFLFNQTFEDGIDDIIEKNLSQESIQYKAYIKALNLYTNADLYRFVIDY